MDDPSGEFYFIYIWTTVAVSQSAVLFFLTSELSIASFDWTRVSNRRIHKPTRQLPATPIKNKGEEE